ncbi:uncharacterized protein LOC125847219 [Solanum stenotomum]|uniref:uncharacterized protein LOC125847219 n=1 Tax=Solanum stenotomum TaxID=172797 RepID=UPI0020D0CF75|nr:uncharacterized protein LOC125847219 [Solanum stenotomum]
MSREVARVEEVNLGNLEEATASPPRVAPRSMVATTSCEGSRGKAEGVYDGTNEDAKKFYNLVDEASQELYPGCTGFSKLSFTLRLYLLKCLHGWRNESFTSLLELLKEVMPELNIPPSYNKTKSMFKNLGLDYEKIDACPNDCMLYRNDHKDDEFCHTCGASRYIKSPEVDSELEPSKKQHQVSAKTLRHLPLIPRLKRLFMCSKTADSLRWHDEERSKDGKLRHPADSLAWKDFDRLHPDFALDSPNVRLGLSSDGFNPFRTMSISHSTWPVMLMVYNPPPWMCMKSEYCILSLIIPGPRSPGNDIDIYLQPLIDELKLLWDYGVETYDASRNQTFQMRAALMWIINDFSAYAMLSGWSTRGKFACPCCNYGTNSRYLKHSQKMCYMNHRVFLPMDHPWRSNKRSFNGKTEFRPPPPLLKGTDVFNSLQDFENVFGKKRKRSNDVPWKKRSIFFELPYWKHNLLRHNLDVMHIEKNIVDSILGTLLDISGKTKDHAKARYDLKDMGIRKNLHPKETEDNKRTKFAKACFSMTNREKSVFCGVLKTAKLPDGSASNISRCVQLDERKLSCYKTHDAHFMLHYLLPIPIKSILPDHVAIPLIRLSSFFRRLCQKVITLEELDCLEVEIIETINQLERIFPPTFIDIMIHLPIHLANEVRLGGPVQNRWMYSTEREMGTFKSYIRNRRYPEGCIGETRVGIDCMNLFSKYLHRGVHTRFNKRAQNNDKCDPSDAETMSLFSNKGVPLGAKKTDPLILDNKSLSQAHAYFLENCDEVQEYIRGPNSVAKRYSRYLINGYRFHVRQRDARRKTQNTGVTLVASTTSFASSKDKNPIAAELTYYRRIVDIVELDYYGHFKVVLFNYDNEPSEHLMGPSIPKDNGEVLLTRTDVPETIIDVPSEEFVTQQLEVEYEEELEDESADEFEDETENEYEDEFENEYEDESEDELER